MMECAAFEFAYHVSESFAVAGVELPPGLFGSTDPDKVNFAAWVYSQESGCSWWLESLLEESDR